VTLENIIKKIDKVPFQEIGEDLHKALKELDTTLVTAQGTMSSARGTLQNTENLTQPNSAQVQQFSSTLQEVSRAARSLRVLADYLERHPEALIRGKKGEAK
jgi:paraquat-inducible protein B